MIRLALSLPLAAALTLASVPGHSEPEPVAADVEQPASEAAATDVGTPPAATTDTDADTESANESGVDAAPVAEPGGDAGAADDAAGAASPAETDTGTAAESEVGAADDAAGAASPAETDTGTATESEIGAADDAAGAASPAKTPTDTDGSAEVVVEPPDGPSETPRGTVDALHGQLLSVMRNATTLGYQGRYDRLLPALAAAYDLDFMANKAAGRHWRELDEQGQQRWTNAFKRFTAATYASRFKGFSGQSFETLGNEPASHETILVRTRVNDPEGENVDLNYRLRETDAGWKIIDVYLNGSVSELALRRAEYSTAFDRNGLDEVIASLENKIDDLSVSTEN